MSKHLFATIKCVCLKHDLYVESCFDTKSNSLSDFWKLPHLRQRRIYKTL